MIVPMKGKNEAIVAQPTRKGSAIRRRASMKVKTISAIQIATRAKIARLTAVLRVLFVMSKMVSGKYRPGIPGAQHSVQ